MKKLSIVIPVFNEEGNIAKVHQEIINACRANHFEFEIIIIDDGSSDKTAEIVSKLSPVKLVQFRKNFGQTAAFDAGIKLAANEYIVTLDGDGQNDPADIPKMIQHLENNQLDAVSGWREDRKDSFGKKLASRGADWLRRLLINDGVHDSGCSLKVYKKECFQEINLYGELHRFIPAILKVKGYRVGELAVNHRPRIFGKTKYNWKRIVKGLIDLIAVWFWGKYAVRPLHLLGGLGIVLIFFGLISGSVSLVDFLAGSDLSNTVWPLLTAFFLIMGVQLFVLGLLADILIRNYFESTKARTYYNIKEIIENK
jgi:glycosyltransferase involved in cell wall biosynthesis